MATYRNGNVWRATPNTVTSMKRSAANRQCPRCQRKSALRFFSDDVMFGNACRWDDCKYENMTIRPIDPPAPEGSKTR